jgi:nucleotide-binding universal stress UspA family protein
VYDDMLIPTDGSPGMETVIEHAVSLARVHGATLHGLYVVNTAALTDLPMESSWEGVNQALQEEGRAALGEIERLAKDLPLELSQVDGSPAREIVDYAEEEGIDVIVMGTHGRSGVDRLLLGSVAERVVRSSTVPVLTIRVETPESGSD